MTNHEIIENELRNFPWDNYGMDDVQILLEEQPLTQEWVIALADDICYELGKADRLK